MKELNPEHLTLGDLIARLKQADPDQVLPVGFASPHSYRGYYEDLAFEMRRNITVGMMLAAAESALGTTFQGWKGGDYTMGEWTSVWLVREESWCGESIGAVFLDLMLGQAKNPAR